MSNLVNKVKDVLTGNKDHDTTTGTAHNSSNPNYYSGDSTNAGPHSSNVGNKLDPRVDSDRDGSRTAGTGNTYGSNTGTHGMTGMTGTSGAGSFGHIAGDSHGTHSSGMANRADPFVDTTSGTTSHTHTGGMGTGMGTGTGHTGSTTGGPHNSNIANKLDPRVDSDRDGSYTVGNTYGTGNTYGSSTGTGMTGTGGYNSKSTAGPHKSDMANKLDPRVDSDLDGSRNMGSGQNYGSNY